MCVCVSSQSKRNMGYGTVAERTADERSGEISSINNRTKSGMCVCGWVRMRGSLVPTIIRAGMDPEYLR